MRLDRLAKGDVRQRRALQKLATATSTGTSDVNDSPFTGDIDGSNPDFTLPQVPAFGTLEVHRNGILQKQGSDYTLSAATVTFLPGNVPLPGDNLDFSYKA